ncbi:MAG: hypothetical protein GX663_02535 [Clostridiales bacterium]|nr:hypothetical protein [Clostridiales bacterium]
MPFFMLQFLFQELCITAEKPKLGFLITLIAGCTNMVFDALFIVGFGWGLEGAAAATAMSEISSPVVTVLFNWQLLRFAGENGVAAFGAIMYICFIFIAIYVGYSMGVAPIISFNFGAKNHVEMKNAFGKNVKTMACLWVAMAARGFIFAKLLAWVFVSYDFELMDLTVSGLRIYCFSLLLAGFNIFGSGLFTALNNGLISAIILFLRTLVFECGSVLILPIFFGVTGIWFFYIAIGKGDNAEVDFIATDAEEKMYIQVTESMTREDVRQRELAPLQKIRDNYEKMVLSLDTGLDTSYDGIRSKNVIEWLISE